MQNNSKEYETILIICFKKKLNQLPVIVHFVGDKMCLFIFLKYLYQTKRRIEPK